MDRTLDVRTPESVALTYELAGIGSRFLAMAIDFAAQIAVLAAIGLGFYLVVRAVPVHAAHLTAATRFWSNIGAAIVIAIVFFVFFGYFILFEALWNGQTPGKRLMGLRVVRDGGYPVDFTASLVRNMLRVGELAFGAYSVSAIVAMLSPENKRIGDIAAGTIVVRDARMSAEGGILEAVHVAPHYAATAYLSGEERALIKRFLDRRVALDDGRRRALAAEIAARVRPRLSADFASLDDESLLERL
ncbi:MAG: RDD family protein [Candidatus Eremiobacteraeota bacterium]|nr:RDD family protein [Candidatus Eremiobacteraeota bacterium]